MNMHVTLNSAECFKTQLESKYTEMLAYCLYFLFTDTRFSVRENQKNRVYKNEDKSMFRLMSSKQTRILYPIVPQNISF